jgi:hypothetical protein
MLAYENEVLLGKEKDGAQVAKTCVAPHSCWCFFEPEYATRDESSCDRLPKQIISIPIDVLLFHESLEYAVEIFQ